MGEAFVMGNVFEQPFATIWRGEKYRAFRAQMLAGARACRCVIVAAAARTT